MPIRVNPVIYSGFVAVLENKSSFSKSYRRFKRKCHCQSLHQVVKVSQQHLSQEDDVEDLKRILEGLRTIKREYPNSSLIKKVIAQFNRQYRTSRERALASLDATIESYEHKIDALERLQQRDPIDSARLKAELDEAHGWVMPVNNLESVRECKWTNIRLLLIHERKPGKGDVQFSEAASAAVKKMVDAGKLPSDEQLKLWQKELKVVERQFGGDGIHLQELYVAMLIAGREHAPQFIQQLARLKREEPGLLFPDISNGSLNRKATLFADLAHAVNAIVVGEELSGQLDLLGQRYEKPEIDNDPIPGQMGLEVDHARKLVQQMWSDNRERSPQAALAGLTSALGVYLQGSVEEDGSLEMSVIPNEDNITRLAEALVVRLIEDKGGTFSSFALLLERALVDVELDSLDPQSRQIVKALIAAMDEYGGIKYSHILEEHEEKRARALTMINDRTAKGFARAVNEVNGEKEPVMREFLSIVNHLKTKEDFPDFADRLLKAADSGKAKQGLHAIKEISDVINEYIRSDPMVNLPQIEGFDYSEKLSALLYQLHTHDPEKFSQFVLDILLIRERNPDLTHPFLDSLCRGIGFVGGIDPRNMTFIEELLAMGMEGGAFPDDPEVDTFQTNLFLFKQHNGWLAQMDPERPPEGISEREIVDAKKLQRVLDHPEFKKEVVELLNGYVLQDPLSSTEDNRRLFLKRIIPLIKKYTTVMDPNAKTLAADDLMMFVQAVLAVDENFGAMALFKVKHEDIEVLNDLKLNADWAFFSLNQLRSLFDDQEKFLTEKFRQGEETDVEVGDII